MTDRRYNDDEVAAIFAKAAEGPQTAPLQPARNEGLTLADLQEIGREVGIPAEAVARAAESMELQPQIASRRFLGLPIGVERTINLNRWLTEREWEYLVVELREVFNARGTTSSSGSFRQWTNGNLQALLEPTETGHRLRLRTLNGSARASIGAGAMALGVSAAMAIAAAVGGQFGNAVTGIVMMSVVSVGMVANGAIRLPAWARLRGNQMEGIIAKLALPQIARPPDGSSNPPE